jgi:TetR/AcrR family fatty acid metabolism transcriptional regulator
LIDRLAGKLRNLVIEGITKGIFSEKIDVDTFLNMVFGTIDHIIIPWVIFNRKYSLMEVGGEASKLLINAIKVR